MFTKYGRLLSNLEYGTQEYKKCLRDMGPALQHHYENNPHHPEYHEHGIDDMNLIDIIEMVIDWKASTLRYKNGNIADSIVLNGKRFKITPQLLRIIENTIPLLDAAIDKK